MYSVKVNKASFARLIGVSLLKQFAFKIPQKNIAGTYSLGFDEID